MSIPSPCYIWINVIFNTNNHFKNSIQRGKNILTWCKDNNIFKIILIFKKIINDENHVTNQLVGGTRFRKIFYSICKKVTINFNNFFCYKQKYKTKEKKKTLNHLKPNISSQYTRLVRLEENILQLMNKKEIMKLKLDSTLVELGSL